MKAEYRGNVGFLQRDSLTLTNTMDLFKAKWIKSLKMQASRGWKKS